MELDVPGYKYHIRNKTLFTWAWSMRDYIERGNLSGKDTVIEIVNQLKQDGYPPESWHVFLEELQRQLS